MAQRVSAAVERLADQAQEHKKAIGVAVAASVAVAAGVYLYRAAKNAVPKSGPYPVGSLPSDAYDAVIVGAGPSGSVCGNFMAKAGAKVALLDKATFPRGALLVWDGGVFGGANARAHSAALSVVGALPLQRSRAPLPRAAQLRRAFWLCRALEARRARERARARASGAARVFGALQHANTMGGNPRAHTLRAQTRPIWARSLQGTHIERMRLASWGALGSFLRSSSNPPITHPQKQTKN